MPEIKIDLAKTAGKIKPMNAVNNGPLKSPIDHFPSNFESFKAANIPYARNHDASFFIGYGGEHIVDVHRIFKGFDSDENDPANYIFEPTDEYVKTTIDAGTKVFYRLGSSIEHGFKYGTRVPKDFAKWARICEHIIRHYTEGWANGFNYDIEYWEIWNEADCVHPDGTSPCWQGTPEQYLELYKVTANHLKKEFPHLKIGGPAFCNPYENGENIQKKFLDMIERGEAPLDFYSYHWYGYEVENIADSMREGRRQLDRRGLTSVPTILNEWNYVRGWDRDTMRYSIEMEKSLKGSAFITGVMCAGQHEPVDMLMYYDARPHSMNGMFDFPGLNCLKGYYPFVMFDALAQLGTHIPTRYGTDNIYSCAATDGENYAVMLSHYTDDDKAEGKSVTLKIEGCKNPVKASIYVLDESRNLELTKEEQFSAGSFDVTLDMPLFTSVLLKFQKI
ncbi:MAG: hypothetical protein IKU43_03555 [Clostridia bacterium]|nr:hypothetical protein [Clostridia bacterium]